MFDADYNSRELSLWPQWDMRWTFGLRVMSLFFDSQATQSFSQAAANNGIVFQARDFNNFAGLGPHFALEMARHLGDSGWSFYVRGDVASLFAWTQSGWIDRTTTLGPNGQPLPGETRAFGHQTSPVINFRTGVIWQPAPSSGTRLFLGYQYERFWALDRFPRLARTPLRSASSGTKALSCRRSSITRAVHDRVAHGPY